MIFIRPPQLGQSRGSAFQTCLMSWAQRRRQAFWKEVSFFPLAFP